MLDRKKVARFLPIPIVITTYNRIRYLHKCLWSIVAATKLPYKLIVCDDGSTDGSLELLDELLERELVHQVFRHNAIGTANQFNRGIEATEKRYVVIANDDMYFHRGWDEAVMTLLTREKRVGTISFYNYTRTSSHGKLKGDHYVIPATGLGAALLDKTSWERVGKFVLPEGKRMGYFASPFCAKIAALKMRHLVTVPYFADHMDLPNSKLSERRYLGEYILFRQKVKR